MGEFFAQEIAAKLDADFYIGVPDAALPRVAHLIPPTDSRLGANVFATAEPSIAARSYASPRVAAEDSWTLAWKKAEIPAANGHGNARAVAKIHAVLANHGESKGVRLLSEETARSVMVPRISGYDQTLGMNVSYGLGFGLIPAENHRRQLSLGRLGWLFGNHRISISCEMNKMHSGLTGDERGFAISRAVFDSVAS